MEVGRGLRVRSPSGVRRVCVSVTPDFLAFSSPGRRGSEPRCVSTSHARPRSHRWRPDGRRRAARSAWKRTGSTLTSRGALVCAARAHRRLSIAQGVHPDLLIVLPFSCRRQMAGCGSARRSCGPRIPAHSRRACLPSPCSGGRLVALWLWSTMSRLWAPMLTRTTRRLPSYTRRVARTWDTGRGGTTARTPYAYQPRACRICHRC